MTNQASIVGGCKGLHRVQQTPPTTEAAPSLPVVDNEMLDWGLCRVMFGSHHWLHSLDKNIVGWQAVQGVASPNGQVFSDSAYLASPFVQIGLWSLNWINITEISQGHIFYQPSQNLLTSHSSIAVNWDSFLPCIVAWAGPASGLLLFCQDSSAGLVLGVCNPMSGPSRNTDSHSQAAQSAVSDKGWF